MAAVRRLCFVKGSHKTTYENFLNVVARWPVRGLTVQSAYKWKRHEAKEHAITSSLQWTKLINGSEIENEILHQPVISK